MQSHHLKSAESMRKGSSTGIISAKGYQRSVMYHQQSMSKMMGTNSVAGSTVGPMSVNRVIANSDGSANGFQGTVMGGRHEQASLRSRNTNNIN